MATSTAGGGGREESWGGGEREEGERRRVERQWGEVDVSGGESGGRRRDGVLSASECTSTALQPHCKHTSDEWFELQTIHLMHACIALEEINFTITHEDNTSLLELKWFTNAFSELSSGHQRTHTIQLISHTQGFKLAIHFNHLSTVTPKPHFTSTANRIRQTDI